MNNLLAFFATFLHEGGWIAYVRGIATHRPWLAVLGNAWILATGGVTTVLVARDLSVLPYVVAGGVAATALLWRWLR